MRRRAFVGVAATALASGCFGYGRYLSEPGGSVELSNRTDESVSVHIRLEDDTGGVTLDETYEVAPESDREVEDAFGGGSYGATVSVNDGELTGTDDLNVGSCSAISLFVRIRPEGLELSQTHCD